MELTKKEHGRNSESRKCPAFDRGGLLSIVLVKSSVTWLVYDMHTFHLVTQW